MPNTYFDRMLSEALKEKPGKEATREPKRQKKRKPWSDEFANDILNRSQKEDDPALRLELQNRLDDLMDKYPAEYDDWYTRNENNPDYKEALSRIAKKRSVGGRGENLVTWMLRHLVGRVGSNTPRS